jgi:Resolvase, N terminal domain
MLFARRIHEADDRDASQFRRAVIYLREPDDDETRRRGNGQSVMAQRLACHYAATVLDAEIVGEFVDAATESTSHPALERALQLVDKEWRLDFLIVASLDRLGSDLEHAFETAWRLGYAGTVLMPAHLAMSRDEPSR